MFCRITLPFLVLGLLGFSAFASAGPVSPPDLCSGAGCTPEMQAIFDNFQRARQAPDAKALPAVFSGECYYLGFSTDPAVKQYGVSLLDLHDSKPWFMALFGFFHSSNPFKDLDVPGARALLAQEGSTGASLEFGKDFAYAEFPGDAPTTRIRYWIRQDPISQRLLLVSFWAFGNPPGAQEIFCDLDPNKR